MYPNGYTSVTHLSRLPLCGDGDLLSDNLLFLRSLSLLSREDLRLRSRGEESRLVRSLGDLDLDREIDLRDLLLGEMDRFLRTGDLLDLFLGDDDLRDLFLGEDDLRDLFLGDDDLRDLFLGEDDLRDLFLGEDDLCDRLLGDDDLRRPTGDLDWRLFPSGDTDRLQMMLYHVSSQQWVCIETGDTQKFRKILSKVCSHG